MVTAGTSDLPVAEEAATTAAAMGVRVTRLTDVGIAGIHRLLSAATRSSGPTSLWSWPAWKAPFRAWWADWSRAPVIAVPTSVGYGASFGGVAALLGMLNSCAAGVTVVNIDNGFGAAMAAVRLLSARVRSGG